VSVPDDVLTQLGLELRRRFTDVLADSQGAFHHVASRFGPTYLPSKLIRQHSVDRDKAARRRMTGLGQLQEDTTRWECCSFGLAAQSAGSCHSRDRAT
jgi:hypothetical protein